MDATTYTPLPKKGVFERKYSAKRDSLAGELTQMGYTGTMDISLEKSARIKAEIKEVNTKRKLSSSYSPP